MSDGIFYLDEERGREAASRSPSPSPRPTPSPTPDFKGARPPSGGNGVQSQSQSAGGNAASSGSSSAGGGGGPSPSTLQIPSSLPNLVAPTPQPFTPSIARKHVVPFAATPSFPSPLAQAITVPSHSDASSSSSHSDDETDNDGLKLPDSPTQSGGSHTPRKSSELVLSGRPRTTSPRRSKSPASTEKSHASNSNTFPSSQGQAAATPASILMKTQRSGAASTSAVGGGMSISTSTDRRPSSRSKRRSSGQQPTSRRIESGQSEASSSPTSPTESSHRRSSAASGTSSLSVPGSVSLNTSPVPSTSPVESSSSRNRLDSARRRSIGANHSPARSSKDANILGLGWGTGWETSSSTSSTAGTRDKGKAKDVSGPPSPRITKNDPLGNLASPPRQRRPSEFLNPSSEGRKMPGGNGQPSRHGHMPSLSTSASMISPLNPLPSPWMSASDGQVTSPPNSQASEMSSSTSQSSAGGAMRLNRVPTNVRMAAELIKSTSGNQLQQSSQSSSTATSTSVPTPNPSPAGSLPKPGSMPPPPSTRALAHSTSVPLTGITASGGTASMETPTNRPSLTVPVTPYGSYLSDKGVFPTLSNASVPGSSEVQRKSSMSSLAPPPSSYKGPQASPQPMLRPRPSLPPDPAGLAESFNSSRAHRYRTSMHEPQFKLGTSLLSDSSSQWSPASEAESQTSVSTGQGPSHVKKPSAALGLGFNMPPVTALLTKSQTTTSASGSKTPDMHPVLRGKPTAAKGLHMDLAGLPGDAASHANMIIQSRQAKLQKWRPSSAGSLNGKEARPHLPGRLSTMGVPEASVQSRLESERLSPPEAAPTSFSSPGTSDGPPLFSNPGMSTLERVVTSPEDDPSPKTVDVPKFDIPQFENAHAGPSTIIVPSGGFGMDRQQSSGGHTVGGIEWIDWYDCYKRYKEEKIRAEAQAARAKIPPIGESPTERTMPPSALASTSTSPTATDRPASAIPEEHTENVVDLGGDGNSALALTPMTSRDEPSGQGQGLRKRSMSIRSSLSAMDPTRSPGQKRTNIFERSRQASAGSARSNAESTTSAVKRKKNLVTKMEGWWNAVKSNFGPESLQPGSPVPVGPHSRIPSAPASRRVSQKQPTPPVAPAALLAPQPQPYRRDSGQSLRQITSNNELRSASGKFDAQHLQEAANIVSSTSADIADLYRPPSGERLHRESRPSMILLQGRKPSVVPEEPSQVPSRTTSSLEVRRKGGPNLRLDLEPNTFGRDSSFQPPSTTTTDTTSTTMSIQPGEGVSRRSIAQAAAATGGHGHSSHSSTGGHTFYSASGLTPGAPRWDETPSPLFAVSTESNSPAVLKEDRPVAPGAEITVANVRRHIKHRLEAAKVACDHTLRRTIDAITRFVDEQKAKEHAEAMSSAIVDDQPRDYFDAMSESPLLDAEQSEVEEERSRSRHASASMPHSRRESISRDKFASPTKRASMLPSSPSRVRRRPSNAPRNGAAAQNTQRLSRNLSLALDRSVSASSSRSTSRSHSPLPTSTRGVLSGRSEEEIERGKQFLGALQDLIVFAQDVLDMSINTLITRPSETTEIIQRLQSVGSRWDEHDDWPGRVWYVDILMAIANLNRVLDWWEAEKGFWNFDDEDADEPILFVVKPTAGQGPSREDSHFDSEFSAAVTDRSYSPAVSTLQVPEPPGSAVSLEVPSPDTSGPGGTARQVVGTAKPVQDADLKFLAEHAKSVNIVMELGLQGEDIQFVNDAILEVTGRDPDEVIGLNINELLAPGDAAVFADATQTLLDDDNNTVQLRFRFEVHQLDDDEEMHPPRQPGPLYVELEGVGMLMRENDEPSHTMWVLRPVLAQQVQVDHIADAAFPRDGQFLTEGILCRICEREIVTWFFEKHNETCDAVHRLEQDIYERNEMLHDLEQVVTDLQEELEMMKREGQASPQQQPSVVFFEFPESIATGHDADKLAGAHGIEVKKVAEGSLQNVIDILQVAQQVETPSVQDEEADLPFNVQRYLSPESEEKLNRITRWQRPATNDRALQLLFAQVEDQLRRKQKAVARMQNTFRYSEKTRHEWEDKVNQILDKDGSSHSESGSTSGGDALDSPIDVKADQQGDGPDTSPPHRKIAPQARLPITQGHPQRPQTSHGESGTITSMPSTPLNAPPPTGTVPISPPLTGTFPDVIPRTSTPESVLPASQPTSSLKAPSPLAIPERKGMRRTSSSKAMREAPLSPRIPPAALPSRSAPPSIKDFEIIKPISRGAFGSVYLAKKVATGDYFAIKALKKSDMIAKNQITNVKAERTILMNQASSPYVVKLFFSFQSKDYLYLVMEYLNGGDCANLVKTLGGLSEDWARNYIAEVVLGLEYLHARNIVHRDIKPDNLLIDARGHLKLTDFGLSRIGLLNRQVGGPRNAYLRGTALHGNMRTAARASLGRHDSSSSTDSPLLSPELMPPPPISSLSQSYFNPGSEVISADESSGSESAVMTRHIRTRSTVSGNQQSTQREAARFVGTPDYLSPETVLGIGTDDRVVDWWALGVVLYEFLYGLPPFHAETPEKVFVNIVSRRIDWHEAEMEVSPEAHDLMDRLMCYDPSKRLGAKGAEEVKKHPFFEAIDWKTITSSEASFVPAVTDPESTDYFDSRGAVHAFHDDDAPQVLKQPAEHTETEDATVRGTEGVAGRRRMISASAVLSPVANKEMSEVIHDIRAQDDFGAFDFKNLPVLKQANDDVIRKLRVDSMAPMSQTLEGGTPGRRNRSLSSKVRDRSVRKASDGTSGGPPSPSTSTSSAASTPSRASIPPSTPGSLPIVMPQHFRRPSELNALDRVKSSEDSDLFRRSSAPTRIRTGSASSVSDRSASMEMWKQRRQSSLNSEQGPPSGVMAIAPPLDSPESHASSFGFGERTLDVLVAEDNPISQKILETLLTRMGCRCVCVEDGAQALAATMGSIHFDLIICDIHMPVVSGEQVARMIRSTNNHNQHTPIIACTSYEEVQDISEEGTLFSAILPKPVVKADLARCLAKLGFVLSSAGSQSAQDSSAAATQSAVSTGQGSIPGPVSIS